MSFFVKNLKFDLLDGLAAKWDFNEAGGDITLDSSGNNAHGTLILSPTRVENGLSFNADSYQSVSLANVPSLKNFSKMSICLWVKNTEMDGGLIERLVPTPLNGYRILMYQGTTWFGLSTTNNGFNQVNGEYYVNDNAYHFVVGVYDGTTIRQYMDDGFATNQTAAMTGDVIDGGDNGRMADSPLNVYYYNGIIKLARIYNRALSLAEIKELYRDGRAKLGF